MGEEKFASLSSGLLARKGAAKPAMRRQGYINPQGDVADDLGWNDMGFEPPRPIAAVDAQTDRDYAPVPEVRKQLDGLAEGFGRREDDEADQSRLTVVPDAEPEEEPQPAIAESHDLPVEPVAEAQPAPAARIAAPAPKGRGQAEKVRARDKTAFTLRLDADRHLRLRLASAVCNRSAQKLVTDALDAFLATIPDIDAMAAQAPRDRRANAN